MLSTLFWSFLLIIIAFVAVFVLSLLFEGIDRKLTARMQNRIGPPIIQPFFDFWKLCRKERVIPKASSPLFVVMPYLSVIFSFLSGILVINTFFIEMQLSGDLIIIIYLLAMPTLLIALGGYASGNPYGAMGASRSLVLLFAYKIPMLGAIFIIAFKMQTFSLAQIIQFQYENGKPLVFTYPSVLFASCVYLICIPAVAGVVPFDIAEAKTEIIYGSLIEYSGLYLALIKLSKSILGFVHLFLSALLFFSVSHNNFPSSWISFFISLSIAFGLMICTISIPRNLFARIKIDQAYRFYCITTPLLTALSILFMLCGL